MRNQLFPTVIITLFFSFYAFLSVKAVKDSTTNVFHEYLKEETKNGRFNGTVMIVKNDSIIHKGAYGSNFPNSDTLKINSEFRIASVSKSFTAMAIMILVERDSLSYNQKVIDFIPNFPYKEVTIKHMLNHTSGLPDYMILLFEKYKPELEWWDKKRLIPNQQPIIDLLIKHKPEPFFEPGKKFKYSNTGYVVLADIVQRISGNTFAQFLNENIFLPLNMNSTSVYKYIADIDTAMPNRVYGYGLDKKGNKQWNDYNFLNGAFGDGGIYSTVEDLLKWDRALYTEKLVKKSTLNEAYTNSVKMHWLVKVKYGYGWEINKWTENEKIVQHTGGWVGFKSFIYRDLTNKNTVIFLTNNNLANPRKTVKTLVNFLQE